MDDAATRSRCRDCPAEWMDRRHRVRHWDVDTSKLASTFDTAPDPRISTLRPAWLADDQSWRDELQAMDLDSDVRWVERHWDMAGGAKPAVDTSWITYETIGDARWVPVVGTVTILIIMAAGVVSVVLR